MKTNWPAFRCGCLILTGAVLGVIPASVRGQESAGTNASAAVISSVAITQDQQRAAVRVEGAGHLDVHATRIGNPERLVLDFAGARLNVQKTSIPGVSAPVRAVRLGQFRPDVARVVIDLTASAPYQIEQEGGAIVVYLEVAGQPASGTAPAESAPVQTAKDTPHSANAPQASSRDEKSSNATAPQFPLPSELTQPSAALATPSEKPETARAAENGQLAAQQAVQQATTAA